MMDTAQTRPSNVLLRIPFGFLLSPGLVLDELLVRHGVAEHHAPPGVERLHSPALVALVGVLGVHIALSALGALEGIARPPTLLGLVVHLGPLDPGVV